MNVYRSLMFSGILVVLLVFLFFRFGTHYYMDYLWYLSLGQGRLWWQLLTTQFYFYIIGVLFSFLVYAINYGIILLLLRKISFRFSFRQHMPIILGVIFALIAINGPLFHRLWDIQIKAAYAPEYGLKDPIYELDSAFYMFQLDWYQGVLIWAKVLIFLCIVLTVSVYSLSFYMNNLYTNHSKRILKLAIPHIAILLGLLVLVFSASIYLQRYSLIYEGTSAKVTGASYVDVHARSLAYTIFSYMGIVFSFVIAASGFFRNWRIPLFSLGSWCAVWLCLVQFYPSIIRMLQVNPNEFRAEKPYIAHSIAYTREGYGLGNIERKKFTVKNKNLTKATLANNPEIIENIRLWDYRPIRATLGQLQEIRQYYDFLDVDVDRYYLNGKMRQVMIAARELNKNSLPRRSRTWESRHLQYTHGYGLAMAPSNKVTPEGLPDLWIRDFPPVVLQNDLPQVKRPEIYYGELTNDYILVNTKLKEIDYPLEQNFAETVYSGKGGFMLGKGLRYFLIAWNFDTWKFLVSRYINSNSRILLHRNIHVAVRRLAPFLEFDTDPYIVLGEDGRLYWIMDAYTTSDRFPYSERFSGHFLRSAIQNGRGNLRNFHGINYIRNSIKITIDAYDGQIKFYLVDEKDPIGKAWARFLPELIRPLTEMPSMLLKHIRYAEELFFIQATIFTDYHMDDERAFYNLEDRWQIATEVYMGQPQTVEPYYTVIKLPNKKKEEYILMLPFIPNNKDNMIAWMAARCDYYSTPIEPNSALSSKSETRTMENPYGNILLFDFPRTRQIYGPIQIESRIDQNPEISKDLTLWNQQGSRVIRGNLLTIPIGDTLLYVEPIYLQSTNSPFPELRRVIVADSSSLVMGSDLSDALNLLVDKSRSLSEKSVFDALGQKSRKMSLEEQARQMRIYLQKAEKSVSQGKWLEFGEAMHQLKLLIDKRTYK